MQIVYEINNIHNILRTSSQYYNLYREVKYLDFYNKDDVQKIQNYYNEYVVDKNKYEKQPYSKYIDNIEIQSKILILESMNIENDFLNKMSNFPEIKEILIKNNKKKYI